MRPRKKSKTTTTDERGRNWSFFVYPESAPKNWREIINEWHTPWFESPLHDKDLCEDESGEIKKAHWHIIIMFKGNKSFAQIKELTNKLNAPNPQKTQSMRGSVRYLAHMDNPDKHQYEPSEITGHNGASPAAYMHIELTRSETNAVVMQLQKYIRENDIREYSDLMDYLEDTNQVTEFDVARTNTIYLRSYINSRRHKIQDEEARYQKRQ